MCYREAYLAKTKFIHAAVLHKSKKTNTMEANLHVKIQVRYSICYQLFCFLSLFFVTEECMRMVEFSAASSKVIIIRAINLNIAQTLATAGGPQICKYHLHVFVNIFWVLIRICYKNFKRITCRKIMSGCWLQLKYISIIHCITLILQHKEITLTSPHLLFKLIFVCLIQVLLFDASVKK